MDCCQRVHYLQQKNWQISQSRWVAQFWQKSWTIFFHIDWSCNYKVFSDKRLPSGKTGYLWVHSLNCHFWVILWSRKMGWGCEIIILKITWALWACVLTQWKQRNTTIHLNYWFKDHCLFNFKYWVCQFEENIMLTQTERKICQAYIYGNIDVEHINEP